jgi:RNA polymerase sigma-70 factor (ECF subfamily)
MEDRRVDEATDLSLIERLRQGDAAALEPLMDRHAARAYRVAYGITRDHADAEEVVQDAFLTLYRKVESFEGRAALGSWLYRVVTNAALMKRRAKRPEQEVSLDGRLPEFDAGGGRIGDRDFVLADWSQDPEAELLSREMRSLLDRAIATLPGDYRTVLLLRDVEGLSNEAVAEIVGDSVSAVKSRLHRARMALREDVTRALGPERQRGWLRSWGKRLGLWPR